MSATTGNGDPRALPALPPLAVDAEGAAALVGVSRRTWGRLNSAGLTPAPIRLGGCCRWSVEALESWVRAGCPARERWETTKRNARVGGEAGDGRSSRTFSHDLTAPRTAGHLSA